MLLPLPALLPEAPATAAALVLCGVAEAWVTVDGKVDGVVVEGEVAGGVLCSGVAAAVVMGWAPKLLAAMVAAAWMDLSVRSAGRGSECASLGKLSRAPLPLNARAAASWHKHHPNGSMSTHIMDRHGPVFITRTGHGGVPWACEMA
jgi:hypothetical protein